MWARFLLRGSCRRGLALLCAALLWGFPAAWAWPVDVVLELKKGEAKFVRLSAIEWLEVEDASVATAELFETKEILFEAKKAGTTLLLLYAEGRAALWRVKVEEPAAKRPPQGAPLLPLNALEEAKQACPKLSFTPDKQPKISGHVDTEACRQALLFLLMQPEWLARELELIFTAEVLASQLAHMQKAVEEALGKGKANLRYAGATLEMSGKLSPEEHRKALWSVFFQSAGRIALNDSVQVLPPLKTETPKEKKL